MKRRHEDQAQEIANEIFNDVLRRLPDIVAKPVRPVLPGGTGLAWDLQAMMETVAWRAARLDQGDQ